MAAVTAIAMLALIEYVFFSVQVSRARTRTGLAAPAVSGNPEFERVFRAHANTTEQLVVFLPALYAAGYFVHELFAVAAGVVFLVGRALYFRSYAADAARRGPGMIVTTAANLTLVIGGLVGSLRVAF